MTGSGTLEAVLPRQGGACGTGGPVRLPALRALSFLAPVGIFPCIAAAAMFGGWWLAGPFLFVWITDQLDPVLGVDERDFRAGSASGQLLPFRAVVWLWVGLYFVTFLFAFRQVFAADHLALWESALLVLGLGSMARLALNAGHEMMHRRTGWERGVGEVLMASVSFPQEITEHIYVHHAWIGTPRDSVSPPKGTSFWRYLPRSVARSFRDTWIVERERLARRGLTAWSLRNPVWRYVLETAAWYGVAWWIGGAAGMLAFLLICAMGISQLRMADYIQHYGLQRIRLPGGRYEHVRPRHSWTSAYRLSNWLYYNAQRHADHHLHATRPYPVLRHSGPEESPELPGSYSAMGSLLLFPRRWFEKMDPLVDRWRARFYPEIEDWTAYDSAAYDARPDAFEVIDEVLGAAPRLAPWMNRDPGLLDVFQSREFTDLDLPAGFGADPRTEKLARRGLARLYWTRELDVAEMRARIAEIPARSLAEKVEEARNWSNGKVFQLSLHMIRGNLTPTEAGIALTRVAAASIAAALSAVHEDFDDRGPKGGVVVVASGDMATGDALFGRELRVRFFYEGSSAQPRNEFSAHCLGALRELSLDNPLFVPLRGDPEAQIVSSIREWSETMKQAVTGEATPEVFPEIFREVLRMRPLFAFGDSDIGQRFDQARLDILSHRPAREIGLAGLREDRPPVPKQEADPVSVDDIPGGFRDTERAARFLQWTHGAEHPRLFTPDTLSVFRIASELRLGPEDALEDLTSAATLWRNTRGFRWLLAEDDGADRAASSRSKAALAKACEAEDFDALAIAIRDRAARARSGIEALTGST